MQRYIILDIDRTIINGTSWYHSCIYPDLLIPKDKVEVFKNLNISLYENGNCAEKERFRELSICLINKRVSVESISILKSEDCDKNVVPYQYIDDNFFGCVGSYTMKKLIKADCYCIKIISMIYRYYTGNVKILFLTSGYTSYMRGLISEYMCNFRETIDWDVIGTDVCFSDGDLSIKTLITQTQKYNIVRDLITHSQKIVFLADDSCEEERLFAVVRENNGYVFNVKYNPQNHELNWRDLYEKFSSKEYIKKHLMRKSTIQLSKNVKEISFFDFQNCNEIGILKFTEDEFLSFCNELGDEEMCYYINKIVYKKDNFIYSRGYLYYFWLPAYISWNFESKYFLWEKLFSIGLIILSKINRKKSKLGISNSLNLLVYMLCDHLLSALYLALYCMEKNSLIGNYNNNSNYKRVQRGVFLLNQILHFVLEKKNYISKCLDLEQILRGVNISELCIIGKSDKYLLELDNYITIFTSCKTIIEEFENKLNEIDAIVCFSYGGIALGYALHTIMNSLRNIPVEIYTVHYSSKKFKDIKNFLEQIPIINCEKNWKDSRTILLIDNNATTFQTLQDIKKYLISRKNIVYCAVAEVDYDNISKWILNLNNHEDMCNAWYDTLDFSPINEYVSAYNTWGTSKKSALLEELYFRDIENFRIERKVQNIHSKHRKICRVHNIHDFQIAVFMGATMIGIHAVISRKNDYYNKENVIGNYEMKYFDLPVPDYEVDSIREMVKLLEGEVVPVLVIEEELKVEEIFRIIKIYGLDIFKSGIQLQCLVSEEYINSIINMGFAHLIISVGITQEDKVLYVEKVEKILREDKDFILVDMSKHQPHCIGLDANSFEHHFEFNDKWKQLGNMVDALKKVNTPILLADDLEPAEFIFFQLYLISNGVNIVGLDMQNNIELNKSEQCYCRIRSEENEYYYAKIRKSIDTAKIWQVYELDYLD